MHETQKNSQVILTFAKNVTRLMIWDISCCSQLIFRQIIYSYYLSTNLNFRISLIWTPDILKMNNGLCLQCWDTFFMRGIIVVKSWSTKVYQNTLFFFFWKGNNVSETWATLNRWVSLKASVLAHSFPPW